MTTIASLLPTGTVSGAPKLRAIQRIYESHPYKEASIAVALVISIIIKI